MALISLIIPIYNAEKYIDRALNSIVQQSIGFNNIELILVDDCSSDDSEKIICKYLKKYDNIIYIQLTENHGYPGFGRNVGLKNATSDFIMFMDNDDYIDSEMCRKLYDTIIDENADIVCCDKITKINDNNLRKTIEYVGGVEKDGKIVINNENILLFNSVSVWNKIFKKEIIEENNIKFLENTSADDYAFCMNYYLNSNKLIYLRNYFGYNWNVSQSSLSHDINYGDIEKLIYAYEFIFKKLSYDKIKNYVISNNIKYLILQCTYLNVSFSESRVILNRIHDFEKYVGFNLKLNEYWLNLLNFLILHKFYFTTTLLLKSIRFLRNLLYKFRFD